MAFEAGQLLLHYRLIEKIGEGGMGVVWKALDAKLEREVAVKILPPEYSDDPGRLARFEREVKAVAALNHSGIVTIYSVEEVNGLHFFAMEFVAGKPLTDHVPHDGIPLGRLLELAILLADALTAAHEQGITHRDLKPANIMITADRQVKVLDFGLAKLRRELPSAADPEATTEFPTMTQAGAILGTVPYMSPEQLQGQPVDQRTDIFALGIVLYEMTTGTRPFAGKNAAALISSILRDRPTPLAEINASLPKHLDRVIGRCLEKDPRERYQAALDVRNDLKGLRKEVESGEILATIGLPVAAPKTPALWTRRIWIVLASVVLLSTLGVLFWMQRGGATTDAPATQARTGAFSSVAVLPFVNVGGDPEVEYLSDGITESLINSLAGLSDLRVVSRGSAFRYKGKEVDLAMVARDLSVQAVVTGRVSQLGEMLIVSAELVDVANDAQVWGDQLNRPMTDIFAVQGEIARAIGGRLRDRLTGEQQARFGRRHSDSAEAYGLYLKGRYHWNKRTNDDMIQALEYYRQAIELDSQFALAWSGVADVYATGHGQYLGLTEAEARPKSKAAALRALELDDGLAEAHAVLADTLFFWEFDWEEADHEFRLAMELNPSYASAPQWYAPLLLALGRPDEAIAQNRRAQELDPLSLIMSSSLAHTYMLAGRPAECIDWARRSLEFAPERPGLHTIMARCHLQAGNERQAIESWQRAMTLLDMDRFGNELEQAYAEGGMTSVWRLWQNAPAPLATRFELLQTISHAQLGNHDRAFRLIEEALERKQAWVVHVVSAPLIDPIRSDPRYEEFLDRIGLSK